MPPRSPSDTPIMRQYWAIKRQHPGEILFFHMGDFFEMFYEDAEVAARELGIALTSRSKGPEAIPMAGVPVHAVEGYVSRLVRAGHRVAICEQAEADDATAGGSRKILPREVTRLVSAGTLVEEGSLEERAPRWCLAAFPEGDGDAAAWGLAWADLSTGEFRVVEILGPTAVERLARLGAAECLLPESRADALEDELRPALAGTVFTPAPDFSFGRETATDILLRHFGVQTLDGFGCGGLGAGISAAGALLRYLEETQKGAVRQITRLVRADERASLFLNGPTRRSLELVEASRDGGREGSLLGVMDRTGTAMGGREMRAWLLEPRMDVAEIRARHDAVEELTADAGRRAGRLATSLKRLPDLERIAARVASGRASPRDLVSLREALERVPALRDGLDGAASARLAALATDLDPLDEVMDLVARGIADRPPAKVQDGGVIRDGFHEEIDSLRDLTRQGTKWMAGYQVREAAATGISTLKVGYHRVHGYYIEVPRSKDHKVPESYRRKQTLKNVERFITDELREHERKVLSAGDRLKRLEAEVFADVRDRVAGHTAALQATARAIARLDVLVSLAELARDEGYVRPEMHEGTEIEIRAGRHPVLEKTLIRDPFVPNDTEIGGERSRLTLITGPNMAGKSTYIRQVALITVMAQMGSFVPAASARIGVADRIYTRVGASDEIARGASTFMVEMTETAEILHGSTARSLVILDEVGRGTSTYDGLSLAWAIAEELAAPGGPRTLFATHYHQLTDLAQTLPGIRNVHAAVRESGDDIVFLRTVVPGATDKSYGIHVAKLAGVPADVLERAKAVLKRLDDAAHSPAAPTARRVRPTGEGQRDLFEAGS